MTVSEVKNLFYEATNAKVARSGSDDFAIEKLREAVKLSRTLTDPVGLALLILKQEKFKRRECIVKNLIN